MFKMEIQAKERCIKQKDIPEIMTLYQLIRDLDRRYGVNSQNKDNTFGLVTPDRMLVSESYPANLYFSLTGYSSDPEHLPAYQEYVNIPDSSSMILALRTGWNRKQKPKALHVDEKDQEVLFRLRKSAIEAAKQKMPKRPSLPEDRKQCEELLTEQGFANRKYCFQDRIWVNGPDGESTGSFRIEYSGLNPVPYFSTTFKGWQNQEDMPHSSPVYSFYRKWNPFHLIELTIPEYEEMYQDWQEVKRRMRKGEMDNV